MVLTASLPSRPDGRRETAQRAAGSGQRAAGSDHTCGVRTDGTVLCWGDNRYGQATPSEGSFRSVNVRNSFGHACGLRTDGTVACWGRNEYGEAFPPRGSFFSVETDYIGSCGLRADGSIVWWGNTLTPPEGSFKSISIGDGHACGIRTDSTVACWSVRAHQSEPLRQRALSNPSVLELGTVAQCGRTSAWFAGATMGVGRPRRRSTLAAMVSDLSP